MTKVDTAGAPVRGSRMRIPRSRGATSGFLLILLGAWGALIPFVGPLFDFAWGTDQAWAWLPARGWLEVLPGAATVLGGVLLLGSRNRATAMLGGWITVLAGAWFVVGRPLADVLRIGDVGKPLAATDAKFAALDLTYFTGLGVVIVFLGALALGRLSVRTLRDVQYAQRPVTTTAETAPAARAGTTEPADATTPVAEQRPSSAEPVDERATAVTQEEPRRRGLRGLFRRRREPTLSGH